MNSLEIISKQADEAAKSYVKSGALEPEWYYSVGFIKGATRTVTVEEIEAAAKALYQHGSSQLTKPTAPWEEVMDGEGIREYCLSLAKAVLRAVELKVPE